MFSVNNLMFYIVETTILLPISLPLKKVNFLYENMIGKIKASMKLFAQNLRFLSLYMQLINIKLHLYVIAY